MPPFGESVLERMSSEYYELTSSEKKIVDYIMQHRMETQDMSISQLAEACGVAEATVSRFCRRLGSKGYGAFRLALANSTARWRQDSNPCPGKCWRMIPSGTCARSFTRRTWGPWPRLWS